MLTKLLDHQTQQKTIDLDHGIVLQRFVLVNLSQVNFFKLI